MFEKTRKDGSLLNKPNQRDPLSVLPPELWLQCFTDVVNDNTMNLLPLLLVSQTWYTTLSSAAPLWTGIHVRDNPEYVDCMEQALKLSHGLPLCVTIEIPVNIVEKPSHLIWKETYRIRELVFKRNPSIVRNSSTVDPHLMERFYDAVYDVLKMVDHFPMLEWITLNHAFDYYSLSMTPRKFPSTPNLKGIQFWCISEDALPSLQKEKLVYMSSSSPMRELLPSLPQLKQLKRLILTQVGEAGDDLPLIPKAESRGLPQLQALEFYQDSPQSIIPFLSVHNSSLTELHIKLSWSELEKLAPRLSNLARLHHLHFIIKRPQRKLQGFEPFFPPLHHVRRFQLEQEGRMRPPENSDALLSPPTGNDTSVFINQRHMVSLLDAFRRTMTGVRSLLLVLNEVPTSTLLTLFAAMPHLEKLEFKGQLSKEEGLTLIIPSLEELVVSNETLLQYLQVPNALSIYISEPEVKGRSCISRLEAPALRTLTINSSLASAIGADMYPHLTSLTWLDPAQGCAVAARSFNSLTRILFDHSSPRKECNDFCELILRYPASCKSLHTLEMRAYPEWDILLHMVQRRNLLPGLGVARLTTLKIPGYPAPLLLVPLTELLGGRPPKPMPSIDELCLGMVDGPYFDINVPGCEDCIDSRMTCTSQLDRHNKKKLDTLTTEDGAAKVSERESSEQAEVKPQRGSDPPLPEDLQTWFDGWSVRRTLWYAKWNDWDRHSRRKGACDRHDYGELVSITGDLTIRWCYLYSPDPGFQRLERNCARNVSECPQNFARCLRDGYS